MLDIEAAIKYPFEDDDWITTIGIGGGILFGNALASILLAILSFLLMFVFLGFLLFPLIPLISFIIALPVLGYGIAVLRSTIQGSDMPPRFEDWSGLFRDGFYASVIGMIYSIPMVVIIIAYIFISVIIGAYAGVGASSAGSQTGGLLFALGPMMVIGILAMYILTIQYFIPISWAIYAHEGEVSSAFSLARLKRVAFDSNYAIPWLIAVIGAGAVHSFIGFLNVLIIGFFLQFYLQIVVFRIFGVAYVDVMGLDDKAQPSPDAGQPSERRPTEYDNGETSW